MYSCLLHPTECECPYCGRLYDATDGAEDCGCQLPRWDVGGDDVEEED